MKEPVNNVHENGWPFDFSVIVAVYNVEQFLRECIESVIHQDFGFEKIQLILVDDGSTDKSGRICDDYAVKYPRNIKVIHKKNGGVSSARNIGLKHAEGRYIDFLDSDDKLSLNAMSEVFRFFNTHEEEIDVVSIPIYFFDAASGSHILNEKFEQGSRVIDLDAEPLLVQLHVCVFLKHESIRNIQFDERLAYSEDALFVNSVLLNKRRLGVVSTAKYYYRKRSSGEESALQKSIRNPQYYIPCLERFHMCLLTKSMELFGCILKFIQYTVAYELQWRIREARVPVNVLTESEEEEYLNRLYEIVSLLDDDVIMAQKRLEIEQKLFILTKKYKRTPSLIESENDIEFTYDQTPLVDLSSLKFTLEFFHLQDGICSIEGYASIFPFLTDPVIQVEINGLKATAEQVENPKKKLSLGETVLEYQGFRIQFPLSDNPGKFSLHFYMVIQDVPVIMRHLFFREFFPVGNNYAHSHYRKDGWELTCRENTLILQKANPFSAFPEELQFCFELWKKNELGARKAVAARTLYHMVRPFKPKQLWLLSDRSMKAGDNGEAMFRYLLANPEKGRKVIFILNKESPDYEEIKSLGATVSANSFLHKLLFLICDLNISSHADRVQFYPFLGYHDAYRDLIQDRTFIYLQHGIMQGNLANWLGRSDRNIARIVTSTEFENHLILSGGYGYTEKNLWLAGSPRFDSWYHDEKQIITIMPTWRSYLAGNIADNGIREVASGFTESKYYTFYNGLINHKRLLEAAAQYGYQIQFMPHPNMQSVLSTFKKNDSVKFLGLETHCRDVYAQSKLLVTDYSSVGFDFAYLRKPVIYCQFDLEEYLSGEHIYSKREFYYERDGFGEVRYDLESTVDQMIEYMKNGCVLKDKYRERIDKFFAFNDQNNCQRVYRKLLAFSEEKNGPKKH